MARVLGMVCSGRKRGYTASLLADMLLGTALPYWTRATWAEYLELQVIGAALPKVYGPRRAEWKRKTDAEP